MRGYRTEKEQLIYDEQQIYQYLQRYRSSENEFSDIAQDLKNLVYINKRSDFSWHWGNPYGLEVFGKPDNPPNFDIIIENSQNHVLEWTLKKIRSFEENSNRYGFVKYPQLFETAWGWEWLYTFKLILDNERFINFGCSLRNLFGVGDIIVKKLDGYVDSEENWLRYKSLTSKEREILFDSALLPTVSDIADKHHISKNTIRKHKENIRRKTGCNSELQLIRFADAFVCLESL
jgi:DNA-binding CsgD family transcriptional regulator